MFDRPTILIAESRHGTARYLEVALTCHGFEVEVVCSAVEAIACLKRSGGRISGVLLDVQMPGKDGLEALREIRRNQVALPVVLYSQGVSSALEAEARACGASDFVTLPVSHTDLAKVIRRHLPRVEDGSLTADAKVSELGTFLCKSPRMREIRVALKRLAASDVPVVFYGESGVGKEVLARALHVQSPRSGGPFVKLNCAAVPSELLESELFGYERGAFTGAFRTTPGKFEQAQGGTVLLDEIGDMDLKLQAKLLHVLQDHEFQRPGGRDTVHVNVRVLAATHRDLETEIREGRFRADLYFRLNVIRVDIPPLRERPEEILPFVELFLKKHAVPATRPASLPEDFERALLSYDWPGNVRELENVIQRLVVLQDPKLITEQLLAGMQRRMAQSSVGVVPGLRKPQAVETIGELLVFKKVNETKAQMEEEVIRAALDHTYWHRKKAAQLLAMDYKALLYKMKKLGIYRKCQAEAAGGSAA